MSSRTGFKAFRSQIPIDFKVQINPHNTQAAHTTKKKPSQSDPKNSGGLVTDLDFADDLALLSWIALSKSKLGHNRWRSGKSHSSAPRPSCKSCTALGAK